jgi:predicted Rossmann-fold nucleotide-binding protein
VSERRVLVCGGRDYDDRLTVEAALGHELAWRGWDDEDITVVHGGARGADLLAADVARNFGYDVEVHRADWKAHGRGAGPMRNEEMAASGIDLCIAFPGGRGTEDMVRRAEEYEIPVVRIDHV